MALIVMAFRGNGWTLACSLGLLLTAAGCFQSHEKSVLERKRTRVDGGVVGVGAAGSGADGRVIAGAPSDPTFVVPGRDPSGREKVRRERETPAERGICEKGGYCAELGSAKTTGADLLFVVDNSSSMREEQAALSVQFPRMIRIMTGGEPNSRGEVFPPVSSLHLGVVSTDMGVVGVPNNWPGCSDPRHIAGGDDGVLEQSTDWTKNCNVSAPSFLTFSAGQTDPEKVAQDFGCIATLGTDGCGFEQPLEAALKALWPRIYIDQDGNQLSGSMNPIQFLSTTADGLYGHGDTPPNRGFLRNDPVAGVSLLQVIVVTDEEDCSSRNTSHLAPSIDPNDPQSSPPVNLRCFSNKQNLYEVERYVNGLKSLRPGYEDTVVFGALVGVPPDLAENYEIETPTGFTGWETDIYFDRILNDPRMQERVLHEDDPLMANLAPSCSRIDRRGERADAYPPRRIVEVAKGFHDHSWVASICQDDFTSAIDNVFSWSFADINSMCLPRALMRNPSGKIDCEMIVELPPPGPFAQPNPTECTGPLMSPVSAPRSEKNPGGGVNCKITQLAVHDGMPDSGEGFYYDNTIGAYNKSTCMKNRGASIRFTDNATSWLGLRMYIDCSAGIEDPTAP
ncbi:MAG TPA: hypothetical protein VFG30_15040 [Polyangiales bacterium]|nr:hypothetical protein [Polyangiales bacterium]